jgi:SAM-dependent methyltransferase
MNARALIRALLLRAAWTSDRIGRGFRGAAAGTMRLDDLRAGIAREYSSYNTSPGAIDAGLLNWEADLIDRFVQTSDRVLVVGAGTGRDMLALLVRGCEVTGIEPSPMSRGIGCRALAERGFDPPIVPGYFEDVDIDGPFDVVCFSNFCYSCIPVSERRVAALKKAARLLAPDGRVFVSFTASRDFPRASTITVARAVGALCGADWRLEQGDNLTPIQSQPDLVGFDHVFGPGEFEREAANAGLHIVYRNEVGVALQLASP